MSPLPVRVDVNASDFPSGENSGRPSVAGCATSNRASPPLAGALQMSPPETKTTVLPSGESEGSKRAGWAESVVAKRRARIVRMERNYPTSLRAASEQVVTPSVSEGSERWCGAKLDGSRASQTRRLPSGGQAT